MAITRLHTWVSLEILTASDLNAEFDNIITNGTSVAFPLTGSVSAGGFNITNVGTLAADTITIANLLRLIKGADIASAATVNLSVATGNFVHITGTTTITSFGTQQAGTQMLLEFDGALTLTHNATSLILPSAANITTAAGDTLLIVSEGSSNWRVLSFQRKDGTALVASGLSGLTTNGVAYATSASAITSTAEGASNRVLRGNTGGAPAFGQIVAADITNGTITTTQISGTAAITNAQLASGGSKFAVQLGTFHADIIAAATNPVYEGCGIVSTTEEEIAFFVPFACTVKNLYIRMGTTNGTITAMIRKGGVDTALTIASAAALTALTNLTNTVSFATGDKLGLKISTTGDSGIVYPASIELVPT